MGVALNIFFTFFKLLIKFLIFTGMYIPTIVFFICYNVSFFRVKDSLGEKIGIILLIISFIFGVLIGIKNFIKLAKADFSYGDLVSSFKKNKNTDFEKIDKSLKANNLESGIILGKDKTYITMKDNEEGHILVVGGQGSGKTSTIAIPTLLNYDNSIFAIDIKGELSNISKNYRKNMKIFNPSNPSTPHYNIFSVLEKGDRVQGAREIVNILIPIQKDIKDPYWLESAQNVLTGAILHYSGLGFDFIETCENILSYNPNELIEELSKSDIQSVRMFINQFVGMENKQLASIYSTLSNNIILFATDSDIKRALSKDGFNFISNKDLENGVDVFINIKEEKLEQWRSLLALITNQFLKEFEKRTNNNENKILFMIDEFPRLGKLGAISNGLSTLRSKGIQIMLIIQSLAQLDSIYGKDVRKIITDNCNYKVVLRATEVETQEYFSKLVGTEEREKLSRNTSKQTMSVKNTNGINKTTEEKKIIKPEEFAYLGEKEILFTPYGWSKINKCKWYEDKNLRERAGLNG